MEEVKNTESRRTRGAIRDTDIRGNSARAPLTFRSGSQFNYPEHIIQDTQYTYGFVPYIIANEHVEIPYDNAIRDGWEPVDSADHPDLRRDYKKDPFNRGRDTDDGFIRKGGNIAMKIPSERYEENIAQYNEDNAHNERLINEHKMTTPGDIQVMSHARIKGRPR
jgi:hypothetical protein